MVHLCCSLLEPAGIMHLPSLSAELHPLPPPHPTHPSPGCSLFEAVGMVQVSKQSQKHAAQQEAFRYAVGSRRPAKPHCSKELLNQRRVVDLLARQGCYTKAAAVQEATNGMEAAEMKATLAAFEAEVAHCPVILCCISVGGPGSEGVGGGG